MHQNSFLRIGEYFVKRIKGEQRKNRYGCDMQDILLMGRVGKCSICVRVV
jgi:hypothetical protein